MFSSFLANFSLSNFFRALPQSVHYFQTASHNPLQPPEKAGEDVSASDDSEKETVTLNIPLNDTGSAGLGVSVKGKTATTPTKGHHDLGIFIKSVITGGAASKVRVAQVVVP